MKELNFLTERPIAHRGYHDGNQTRMENSLSAFRAAVDRDFAIELDVHLSSDGEIFVFHDDTLSRLTDRTDALADLSGQELQGVVLGGTGDKIPSLKDVLGLVGGRVPIVIEMKDQGQRNAQLAAKVAQNLRGYNGPVATMSFEHDLIAAFQRTDSDIACGLTAEGIGAPALDRHMQALTLGISFVSYHFKALPNRFVTRVHETLHMPVITWTARSPEDVAATREYADQMTFEGFDPDSA